MRNPFSTPLPGTGTANEYGYPNSAFDMPSDLSLDSVTYPELTGLGGGVSAYRGNQDVLNQSSNPGYAGEYHLRFADSQGLSTVYTGRNVAAGSADLIVPRDTGGIPGTDRIIQSVGPVTGVGSEWSGIRETLHAPNPNYAGPVTGGSDYSHSLASSFFAAQAQTFSEMASASAMVAAI
jgi:hypothetical protein